MVYELVSNSPHGNNVALYKCYDNGSVFYRKTAYTESANRIIENEATGYRWFAIRGGRDIETRLVRKRFYELDIPRFKGKGFPEDTGINGNEAVIERLIEVYRETWLEAEPFSIHGDLALGNILVGDGTTIHIIDWEHFHHADRAYFGFDMINMLFIALLHESRNIISNKRTRDFLKACYRSLAKGTEPSNRILEKPFQNSSAYLRSESGRFTLNVEVARKFILAGCPEHELARLDLAIT
jgi:hypothetical protein